MDIGHGRPFASAFVELEVRQRGFSEMKIWHTDCLLRRYLDKSS